MAVITRGLCEERLIEVIPPENAVWNRKVAERTRQICYSSCGFVLQVGLNACMFLLNGFLIVYEIVYLHPFKHPIKTPLWFIELDLLVIIVLCVEVCVRFCEFGLNCRYYCCQCTNLFDVFVLLVSLGAAAVYIFEDNLKSQAADSLTFLAMRVFRDGVRMIRCIWFLTVLYQTFVDFEKHDPSAHAWESCPPESSKLGVAVNSEYGTVTGRASFSPERFDDQSTLSESESESILPV